MKTMRVSGNLLEKKILRISKVAEIKQVKISFLKDKNSKEKSFLKKY